MNALASEKKPAVRRSREAHRPRVGFVGLGWTGRRRLEAMARSDLIEVAALSDTSAEAALSAASEFPRAEVVGTFEKLLGFGLDGLVISTPSALHAQQSEAALDHGIAVFCQRPLGRNGSETGRVIESARRNRRLLGVDLSYRHVTPLRQVHDLCETGELGDIYVVDLMFHDAHKTDKPRFHDSKFSLGGCVMDLAMHLVDLALWNLGFPKVIKVTSHLFSGGKPLTPGSGQVEDHAMATLNLETGATVRIACSWRLPTGCDAIISGSFFGTRGGAAFRNLEGSFYDFKAERFHGTKRETLNCFREQWVGRAAVHWAEQLVEGGEFNPEVLRLREVASALDEIYKG